MDPKLIDTFKQTADQIAFLDRGYGIGKPDVQSAIEKVYSKINRTSPTLEIVSVKDFGAVGDGVTDDTNAIQNAVEYCRINKKLLFLPAGEYIYHETLAFNDVSVIGAGSQLSKLVYNGDGNAIEGYGPDSYYGHFMLKAGNGNHNHGWIKDPSYSGQNSTFEQIYIDGFNNEGAYGFKASNTWKIVVSKVRISYCWNGMLWGETNAPANDITLIGLDIARNFSVGLTLGRGMSFRVFGGNFSGNPEGNNRTGILLRHNNIGSLISAPYLERLETGIEVGHARAFSIISPFFTNSPMQSGNVGVFIKLHNANDGLITQAFADFVDKVLVIGDGDGNDPNRTTIGQIWRSNYNTLIEDISINSSVLFTGPSQIYGDSTMRKGTAIGQIFFDTALGKPIFYNGSQWVDSEGNPV